jgi:hypothetical protein
MKGRQTSHEYREEILTVFPAGTGEIFHELRTSVVHLHVNWRSHRSLFRTSRERIEVLNWAASGFFALLDGILLDAVMLAIARLTDPPKSAGKYNACLARLIEMLEPSAEKAFADGLQSKLEQLQEHCEPVRQIRNRVLAHRDLDTVLQYHPDPLPGISQAYIDKVLEEIGQLLGDIEKHFRGSPTEYRYVISPGDAESLILALESAREHEKCRQRELNQTSGTSGTTE